MGDHPGADQKSSSRGVDKEKNAGPRAKALSGSMLLTEIRDQMRQVKKMGFA